VDSSDGSVENSSKIGSSNRDLLSRMSVVIEIEDTVETMEDVLVRVTGELSGDSKGVTTVVEDGTCSEGEGTVGGRDGDEGVTDAETDTVPVGVREGDVGE
jgi:hypothetical protein